MREAQEQENLFTMLAYAGRKYPEAQLLFHVPNGGKRNAAEAAHLKRQGVKAGVPDLFLPVARGGLDVYKRQGICKRQAYCKP